MCREQSPVSIASLESLYGRKAFYPFLEAGAVDVAIIDATWNGVWESAKIAAMCSLRWIIFLCEYLN